MRIAHLVCTFPPYKGGMGNVCYNQAKELIRLGHKATVFVPQHKKTEPSFETLEEIKVKRIRPFLRKGQGAFLPQFIWLFRFLNREFDIIHLHYPFFGAAEVIWIGYFLKLLKIPLVLQYHMDVLKPRAGVFKYFLFLNKFILPKILNSAEKIIISSKDYILHSQIKKYIEKYPEKFEEIPFGVDQERFYPQEKDQALLKRHNLKESDKIVLFVGGLDRAHYFKGVDHLIRAFKLVIDHLSSGRYILLIVGQGDLKPSYEKLVQDLKIEDNIIFVDQVSDEDLPKYYNLTDLFVLPSIDKSEAFGLVLLEAMACAKPCLASDLAGVRTVIESGKTGSLVDPQNVDDLAKKIVYLLINEDLSKKLGQLGWKKVKEKYSWRKVGKRLEKCYQSLMDLRRPD